MQQLLIQLIKAASIWCGLIVVLAIIATPLGFFSIQAYTTEDKILMGVYSPQHSGTPAAFNPLVQALIGLGTVAFLLNPLILLALRRWWGVGVRPWLLAIGGFILALVLDMLFAISPRQAVDITTESLWPDFWAFFSTVIVGLFIGYSIELFLTKREQK